MSPEILYLSTFAFSATVIALTTWLAKSIEASMKRENSSGGTGLIPTGKNGELRPVEIGYMLSGGDTNHALLVMGVDLLQRAAKLQLGAVTPEPAEYEKKMWSMAKDTAKEWALSKVDQHVPPDVKTNPVGFVKKIYAIYQFCTQSLQLVLKDIIADPRHLKRYISVAGVTRLLADFISAGYQNAFDKAIRDYLIQNNYLVSLEKRQKASNQIAAVALSIFAVTLLFAVLLASTFSTMPQTAIAAGMITLVAALTALCSTLIMTAREFIPYVCEFESLATTLCRESIRLKILKVLTKAIMAILCVAVLIVSAINFTGMFFILQLMGFNNALQLVIVAVMMTLPCLRAFTLLVRSWKLKNAEIATAYGDVALKNARTRLSKISPISALTKVLKEEDYDPILSEVMALYGLEALILLA